MTDKITLTQLSSLENETTAINQINGNSVTIVAGFDNTLSRDGTSPNQMGANLDMNSNQILNLPSPATVNSPARLQDVTLNPTIQVPPVGTSGATVPFLNGNNTWSGTNTYTGTVTLPASSIFTGDSGSGGSGGIVPSPTTGQGASDAVLKASGSFGVVGLTNVRLSKTSSYTVVNADKGKTIALGGSAFYTLNINAATGYDSDFMVMIVNEDSGRAKTMSINGITNFMLWPNQNCIVFNDNNVWQVNPTFQRWKLPANTFIYVDAINGSDTNDGLASGAGGAVKTFNQAIRIYIKDYFDLTGASSFPNALVTVQLADNATSGVSNTNAYGLAHIAFTPVGNEGRCTILIQGNAATPSNTVISDSGGACVGCYGGVNVELRNLQIGQTGSASPTANACIESADGANVRLEGGVILGTASNAQLQADNKGSIFLDSALSVVGNGSYFINAFGQGQVGIGSQTITFSNSPTYSQQTISASSLSLVTCTGTTFTNGGTVTATKYLATNNSVIQTGTGSGTVIPGGTAGTANTGAQVG